MDLQTVQFQVNEELWIPVYYLQSQAERQRDQLPDHNYPALAGCLEGAVREWARGRQASGKDATTFLQIAERWTALGNSHWRPICDSLVARLPDAGSFLIVPSSRHERSEPLRNAARTRWPDATDLAYKRPEGVRYIDLAEEAIRDSLQATAEIARSPGTPIAILDDCLGNGRTLRAVARRLLTDFPNAPLFAAFPGIDGRREYSLASRP